MPPSSGCEWEPRHADGKSENYAGGDNRNYTLEAAKAKCLEQLESVCNSVTCQGSKCTLRNNPKGGGRMSAASRRKQLKNSLAMVTYFPGPTTRWCKPGVSFYHFRKKPRVVTVRGNHSGDSKMFSRWSYRWREVTAGEVLCWGSDSNNQVTGVPAGLKFAMVSAGRIHSCGVVSGAGVVSVSERIPPHQNGVVLQKGNSSKNTFNFVNATLVYAHHNHMWRKYVDSEVLCWGGSNDRRDWLTNPGMGIPAGVRFSAVSAGYIHTCGVVKGSGVVAEGSIGWGIHGLHGSVKCKAWDKCEITRYQKQLMPRRNYTDGEILCWGYDIHKECAAVPKGVKFETVSVGKSPDIANDRNSFGLESHACGVVKASSAAQQSIRCWGVCNARQCTPPHDLKMKIEKSCQTEHPEQRGPTACTSCGINMHHTILDPRSLK